MHQKIFISQGDITTDYIYDSNYNLIKKDGGGCNSNVLSHLSLMGEKCYAVGTVGSDEEGEIAMESLKRAGVITDLIVLEKKQTNTYHIIISNENQENLQSRKNPVTGQETVTLSSKLPICLPQELNSIEKVLILERMQPINLKFIDNLDNKKVCLDIGSRSTFMGYEGTYLLDFLKKVDVLLLQGNFENMLLSKLDLHSITELFERCNLDLLIVTRGINNVSFVFWEKENIKICEKIPNIVENPVDTTGAGDAFFSVIIKAYARLSEPRKQINSDFIDNVFLLANLYSAEVVKRLGSRADRNTVIKWINECEKAKIKRTIKPIQEFEY